MNGQPRVLFIDDDATVLSSLERTMVGLPLDSFFESSAQRAIERLSTESWDLVISDQRMPEIDGIELLELARQHQPQSHRILLTGHATLELAMAAVNRGKIQCLLTKPWEVRHLREVVLGQARAASFARAARNAPDERGLEQAIVSLIGAIEAKHPSTRGHSELVSLYGVAIGEGLGLSPEDLETIRLGGLLHDCGKIGISETILEKPGPLTDEEFEVMKTHPAVGARIVQAIDAVGPGLRDAVIHHHERWDGLGYPHGLDGEAVLQTTRVIGVADACEAMMATRAYRVAQDHAFVLGELNRQNGHQFDPEAGKVAIELLQSGRFDLLRAGATPPREGTSTH